MLEKYQQGENLQDCLTPYAKERLNQSSNESMCKSGIWQVNGLPYKHVMATILHKCAWPEVEVEPSPDIEVPVGRPKRTKEPGKQFASSFA
ncbi:hypothetical protein WN943_026848 [Citrus x changshan-huyou]